MRGWMKKRLLLSPRRGLDVVEEAAAFGKGMVGTGKVRRTLESGQAEMVETTSFGCLPTSCYSLV